MLGFRSNSIFTLWVSLEFNILRFLPIIASRNISLLENPIKYFLVQRWASTIFLIGNFLSFILWSDIIYLSLIRVLLKLGAAPLHSWFISILKTCDLWVLLLMSTAQKIIPLIIFRWFSSSFSLVIFSIFTSSLVVLFRIPGSVSINKILALSSLGNLLWLIVSSQMSIKLIMLFMIIYYLIIVAIFLSLKFNKLNIFVQLNAIKVRDKINLIFNFISLGGLPPFLGFIGKLIILKRIYIYSRTWIRLLLVLVSVLILYYYLSRLFFLVSFPPSLKLTNKVNNTNITSTICTVSLIRFNLAIIMPL